MNKLQIGQSIGLNQDDSTWALTYSEANRIFPVLRSDHFRQISLREVAQVSPKELRFLIQITRILRADGQLLLDSAENVQLNTLLKTLHLHEAPNTQQGKLFLRSAPQQTQDQSQQKLAIGFHAGKQEEEQIDEEELLKEEGIELKKQPEPCETKPRACANCSCGRKDQESKVTKEELIKSVNEGNPVSGCGKCFLGDSFRCGTCPYKGLPAFKPGDRLKLQQDGAVQVESAATFVSSGGKVRLEL